MPDSLPPPSAFGLPDRFDKWRQHQDIAIERAFGSTKRFIAIVAPTGYGKSIVAMTLMKMSSPERSVYLTSTKALQSQLMEDFEQSGLVQVKGKGDDKYICRVLADNGATGTWAKCSQAEWLCKSCEFRGGGCSYYDAMSEFRRSELGVTNYAKRLSHALAGGDPGEGLGPIDLLICDEAHDAHSQICGAMRAEISRADLLELSGRPLLSSGTPIEVWSKWAGGLLSVLRPRFELLKGLSARDNGRLRSDQQTELRKLTKLVAAMELLSGAADDWCEDRGDKPGDVAFEPKWARKYAGALWGSAARIVLMSATLTRKELELLGLGPDDYEWLEFPSSFPVSRRPVIQIPTVQMKGPMSDAQMRQTLQRVDQIIDKRLDRKGIIHTVSYERAKWIVERSRHKDLMLINETRNTREIVEQFKDSAAPRILVTPSVTTGYDFPGEDCEFQIIIKVPFLNRHASPVVAARCAEDRDFDNFSAMKQLVQMAGRGMRFAEDQCETFVTDDQFKWFWNTNRKFAPGWFIAACRNDGSIPAPPRKLSIA